MPKKNPREIIFKKSKEIQGVEINAPEYKNISFDKFLDSYESMGFQGSNLGKAVKVNGHFFYAADSGSDMPYRNRIDTSESKGNIEIKD